jgi:signal transduction histidine kinase
MSTSDRSIPHQSASKTELAASQERRILKYLTALSYRTGELTPYLQAIAQGVNDLIGLDWSVVTLCQDNAERILASTIDLGEDAEKTYSLHGTLTGTVVSKGCSLVVEDTQTQKEHGSAPDGYQAYLGVPLQTPGGQVIGTICSFQQQPRRFTTQEVHLAEVFAERAAIAIDNYQLYQQQQQFNQALEAEVARRTQELQIAQAQLIESYEQLEERIEQRTVELKSANEKLAELAEIGELAAMIVHEVRNPLTTVLMGLNALQGVELPQRNQQYLALALEDGERLKRLLNEILLYAKQQVLQCSEVELNAFSSEVLEAFQTMSDMAEYNVQFESAFPSVLIEGDRDKLKQVFINLIKNACEAIEPGDVVTWRIDPGTDSCKICIRIHNQGNPIPAEILAKLGTPFFTTKPSGNGLGLAIVRRIVEAHNGKLVIQSEPEIGTTVSIQLPLTQCEISSL